MSIVVTGATGHLGRLIVEALLDNGIPAEDIVATGRAVDRLDDLASPRGGDSKGRLFRSRRPRIGLRRCRQGDVGVRQRGRQSP